MINQITDGNDTIQLRSSSDPADNIFDIDSLSLLIGPNGSGKTQFFKKIVNFFRQPAVSHFSEQILVITEPHGLPADKEELMRWGVAYYSPLPWRLRFRSTNRVADASPSHLQKPDMDKLFAYAELLEAFNITPRAHSVVKAELADILGKIVDSSLSQPASFWHGYINTHDFITFQQLADRYERYSIEERERGAPNPTQREARKQFRSEAMSGRQECITQLYASLARRHGIERVNAVLTVLYGLKQEGQLPVGLTWTVCQDYFNIDFRQQISANSPTNLAQTYAQINALTALLGEYHAVVDADLSLTLCIDYHQLKAWYLRNGQPAITQFEHHPVEMSSGEMAVIQQLISLDEAVSKLRLIPQAAKDKAPSGDSEQVFSKRENVLLLIDEGDAFLHLEWQRHYIWMLNRALNDIKKRYQLQTLQLILATHSPLLASDVPKAFICRLEDPHPSPGPSGAGHHTLTQPRRAIQGFASSMPVLFNNSFGAKTIGEFSASKIDALYNRLLQGAKPDSSDRYLIDAIDNPILKTEIERVILQMGWDDADFNH